MAKLQGRFSDGSDSRIPPLAVTGVTVADVGTSRPFLATANTTSAASAANTGGAVTVSWTVPGTSTAASSYTITTTPATYAATVTGPATSYTFQGLASNASYTFTIVPSNTFGNGIPTTSGSVTSTTVPDVPTGATATAQVNQDSISFTAPVNNGGKAITNYYVAGSDATSANGTTSPIVVADPSQGSQYYNVYADNANGRSLASAATATVTTLPPTFFSPPLFFSPPAFFSPPSFFAPPAFMPPTFSRCIDQDTLIAIVEDDAIAYKTAKEIVIGDKIWAVTWDEIVDEFILDPYKWISDSVSNVRRVESSITNIIPSQKDVTLTINGDSGKRFSLEQTVLVKRNNKYFFATTGTLEIGDILVERKEDDSFVEILVSEITMVDEERTVYEFDASPTDTLIAGNLVVHNSKRF